ncbi:hypothetical protein AB6M97_02220 [Streptococcus hillyeri]|uniref:Uncharacterized protein n=1 Tax=Streptococcus hillyeri TaxID=2282420 RepID=A0A3L9DN31_9STRE|nr:hypothetical protein [Streptococcus hillyeri]RLY01608.1 hypothetical protein EAF07_09350 [Streptococcus hillyeri]
MALTATAALSSHSASAYQHYTNPILKQDGTQSLREVKQAAQLEIRNLLKTHNVTDPAEYKGYYYFYLREARKASNEHGVKAVIDELASTLQQRNNQ